jgi:hypothetical protein
MYETTWYTVYWVHNPCISDDRKTTPEPRKVDLSLNFTCNLSESVFGF